jgi:hypothetical protein
MPIWETRVHVVLGASVLAKKKGKYITAACKESCVENRRNNGRPGAKLYLMLEVWLLPVNVGERGLKRLKRPTVLQLLVRGRPGFRFTAQSRPNEGMQQQTMTENMLGYCADLEGQTLT